MKPYILLIGGSNSGKSTIIQSLTGCKSRTAKPGYVVDRSTGSKIYVIVSSPQESRSDELPPESFSSILRQVSDDSNAIGFVIAIQPTNPTIRLSLEQIVEKAQSSGTFVIYAFALDPPYPGGDPIDVADIRERIKDSGIPMYLLDDRRFAFFNAMEINSITGIP